MRINITVMSDKLLEGLKKSQEYADELVLDAVRESCLLVEKDAKLLCPVDKGRLRANITHEIVASGVNGIEGRVGTNVAYAPYVEYGTGIYVKDAPPEAMQFKGKTGKLPWTYFVKGKGFFRTFGAEAKPFLYPAFSKNFTRITEKITKAVKEATERVAK